MSKEICRNVHAVKKENCGLFGIFGDPEAVQKTYFGLHSLQHRGQESAGIASSNGDNKSTQQMIGEGLSEDVVNRVTRMVDLNEYKRRQSPPGVKITPKAFGKDRRMPITNCYVSR